MPTHCCHRITGFFRASACLSGVWQTRLTFYDTFILVQLRCIQAAASELGRNGQRGYSAVEANQQGALQRLEGVQVTSTNKYEVHDPWYLTITQMAVGLGPGFSDLYNQLRVHATTKAAIRSLLSDL